MGSNSVVNPMGNNFLGTGGTSLNKPLSFISPLNKGFLGGGMTGRVGRDVASMGLGEFTQKDPFGIPGNPIAGVFGNGSSNPGVQGPFSLDQGQFDADRAAIAAEGQKQYGQANDLATQQYNQTINQIPDLVSKQMSLNNPDIMESLNATHQLNSTAYPTELARQQAQLVQSLAIPATQQLQQQQQGALQGLQGYQGGSLQRGLSLEDQINNANISKNIGQVFAPQPPSGKAQFGTAAQGTGALLQGASALRGK